MSSADSDEHTGTEYGSLAGVLDEESNGDDMPATAEVITRFRFARPHAMPTSRVEPCSCPLLPTVTQTVSLSMSIFNDVTVRVRERIGTSKNPMRHRCSLNRRQHYRQPQPR